MNIFIGIISYLFNQLLKIQNIYLESLPKSSEVNLQVNNKTNFYQHKV